MNFLEMRVPMCGERPMCDIISLAQGHVYASWIGLDTPDLRATGIRTGPLSHEKSMQVEMAGIWEEHKGKGAQGLLQARAGTAGVSQAP